MSSFRYRVRVSYIDTDRGGVVHHATYLRYFEQARIELLRARGFDYKRFEEDDDKGLPVAEMRAKFLRPAHFDDALDIETWVGHVSRAKIRFDYRVWRGEELLNEAEVTCACVRISQMKICSMDDRLRTIFAATHDADHT